MPALTSFLPFHPSAGSLAQTRRLTAPQTLFAMAGTDGRNEIMKSLNFVRHDIYLTPALCRLGLWLAVLVSTAEEWSFAFFDANLYQMLDLLDHPTNGGRVSKLNRVPNATQTEAFQELLLSCRTTDTASYLRNFNMSGHFESPQADASACAVGALLAVA
jgi:hypothetical protein